MAVVLPREIDARAPGLGRADLIFVFGTRLAEPAGIAARLHRQRYAPLIVVTGGAARQADGLHEAEHHRHLLLEAGVPDGEILVEAESTNTDENVVLARPLIEQRGSLPTSVIAVVKRHHRRGLVTLARHIPTIERLYSIDYEAPCDTERLTREVQYMRDLISAGVDPLVADGWGWRRSRASDTDGSLKRAATHQAPPADSA